jgi:hypothetical protein
MRNWSVALDPVFMKFAVKQGTTILFIESDWRGNGGHSQQVQTR